MENYSKIYDEALGVLITNLYTISKENNYIQLLRFDPNKKEHLVILYTARGLSNFISKKIEIDMGFWKYIKFYFSKAKKRIKTKRALAVAVDKTCDDLYKDIEKAFEYNGLFESIYNAYYLEENK